jgi:succinate-acetate transporter protein
MFGGVAQFLAGRWAYRARNAVATLAHGTWAAFWMAYLILNILVGTGVVKEPTPWFHDPELGFWFFLAGGLIYGSHGWVQVAGWVLVVSAGLAWYTAMAMLLAASFGRTILPLFKYERKANIPGRKPTHPIQLEWAEPGIRHGQ